MQGLFEMNHSMIPAFNLNEEIERRGCAHRSMSSFFWCLPCSVAYAPYGALESVTGAQKCQTRRKTQNSYLFLFSYVLGASWRRPLTRVQHMPGCPLKKLVLVLKRCFLSDTLSRAQHSILTLMQSLVYFLFLTKEA